MKSPYRPNWNNLTRFTFIGIVVSFIFTLVIIQTAPTLSPYSLPSWGPYALIGVFVFCICLGLFEVFNDSNIFHRKVNNPVKLEELVRGHVYWLNGQTHAQYRSINEEGVCSFMIYGLKNYHSHPLHLTKIEPDKVEQYFSAEEEDFPKKK